jgi:hypothetical protein
MEFQVHMTRTPPPRLILCAPVDAVQQLDALAKAPLLVPARGHAAAVAPVRVLMPSAADVDFRHVGAVAKFACKIVSASPFSVLQ